MRKMGLPGSVPGVVNEPKLWIVVSGDYCEGDGSYI